MSDKQAVAKCKELSHVIADVLTDCFEETCAINKCCRWINKLLTDDINLARVYGLKMSYFLSDLKVFIWYFVPFKDLPSCRVLLDYSPEEAAIKAIDLVENDIVKVASKVISLGEGLYHVHTIAGVKHFYGDLLETFRKDVEGGWKPSPIEMLFEAKCNLELEYCTLAKLKVSGKLTQELLEIGLMAVKKYQMIIDKEAQSFHTT